MPLPHPGRDGVPANAIVHSCGAWWTGAERSHCGGCHITLSSLTAFEAHRRGFTCNDPASVGLISREKPYGILWGWPGPDDDTAQRLAQLRGAA